MTLPTRRPMTTLRSTASALALALGLVACSEPAAEDEPPSERTARTAPDGAQEGSDGRLAGEDIHEDRERFDALAERTRQEFSALAGADGPAPLFHSLHLCSVLYADHDHDRDVQQRYEEFLNGYSGDGFISSETGEHWVDFSIQEFCPDLEPQVAR